MEFGIGNHDRFRCRVGDFWASLIEIDGSHNSTKIQWVAAAVAAEVIVLRLTLSPTACYLKTELTVRA